MITIDRYYANLADARARGPQLYGGDASIAALRCFRRYSPGAHVDVIEGRWTTNKQFRVYAIAKRLEVSGEGMTMRAMAIECQVAASTVSRALLKFQAWGLIAVDVTRGKYGGVRVYKVAANVLRVYIAAAKQKLRDLWRRRFNVAFTRELGEVTAELPTVSSGRNIKTFAERVHYERALLALEDPDGEYESVSPLLNPQDIDAELTFQEVPKATKGSFDEDVEILRSRKMREAAFAGDWREWERLKRAESWGL